MEFDIMVEIPRNTRNKYEWDPAKQRIRLDRMLFTSTGYPYDYGFVPDTIAADGDALDAMVLVEEPTFPGIMITVRPVAVYTMIDEGQIDRKIICVPATDPRLEHIRDMHHIPTWTRDEIGHFFSVYKSLDEPSVKSDDQGHDWDDRAAAERVVRQSQQRWADAERAAQAKADAQGDAQSEGQAEAEESSASLA